MVSLIVLIIFLGWFMLYCTSEKVILSKKLIPEKWIVNHKKESKRIGITKLIVALFLTVICFGVTGGILLWIFLMILMASLLVVIYPLEKINYKHLLIVLLLFVFIELLTLNF